jgi:hypothetical protein
MDQPLGMLILDHSMTYDSIILQTLIVLLSCEILLLVFRAPNFHTYQFQVVDYASAASILFVELLCSD